MNFETYDEAVKYMKQKSKLRNKHKNKMGRRQVNPTRSSVAKQRFNVPEALNSAVQHFYAGRPALAADLCREILSVTPNNATAYYMLGVISHQTGQNQTAIDLINKSLEHEPNNAEAYNYLGIVLVDTKRHHEAVKSFRRAIALESAFPEAYNNLGNVMRHLGRMDDAVVNFRKALELRPNYVEACNGLGCSLKELGQLEDAAISIKKAIAGDNNHHEAHFNLGEVLYDQGRYDNAVESFRKAINIKSDYTEAYINLGSSLQELGRHVEAVALFRKAISIKPDYIAAHNNLGISLQHLGKLEEAAASYRKALAIEPDTADTHNNLAIALQELGTVEDVAAEYENALRLCEAPELKAKILLGLSQLPSSSIQTEILTPINELRSCNLDSEKTETVVQFHRNLAFARAGALDKQRRFEEAWQGYVEANHEVNSFYAKIWLRDLTSMESALKRTIAWTYHVEVTDSESSKLPMPLFILGPSRSGKTTLEKLAGSLDGVKCDYEGLIVSNSVLNASQSAQIKTPFSLAELPTEHGPTFVEHFWGEFKCTAGEAKALTNTNQTYIRDVGWLAQMLPTARFIFVERNKEDTALRIFMKLYPEDTNPYAYDLKHIFSYISWYQQLCDAWEAKLSDVILRLTYEDMIADPKLTRRKLAAFCGLEEPITDAPALGDDRAAAEPYMDFLKAAI